MEGTFLILAEIILINAFLMVASLFVKLYAMFTVFATGYILHTRASKKPKPETETIHMDNADLD